MFLSLIGIVAFAQPDMGHDSPMEDPGDVIVAVDEIGIMNILMVFLGWFAFFLIDFGKYRKTRKNPDGLSFIEYGNEYLITIGISVVGAIAFTFIYHEKQELNYMMAFAVGLGGTWLIKKAQEFVERLTVSK